jgi:fermentation-respiration switch protein FrsA (DUF1100 family)
VKKIGILLIIMILIIAAGILGGAWYFSSQLLHPVPTPCDPEHFVYCDTPDEMGLPFEEVSFPSRDGITIQGWLIPGKGERAVILVHGITADRREAMRWLKPLHQEGFTQLTIDLRNHGKSEGALTTMGLLEKNDIMGAVDFLVNEKNMKSVGVFGVSMGSSAAIHAMAEDRRIKAGIFEAPFSSLRKLLEVLARRDYGLPPGPTIDLVGLIYNMRSSHSLEEIRPVDRIGDISPRPVFIIHCPDDDFVPYRFGREVYQAAGEPKEFWASPCKKHARAWQGNPEDAERRVRDFFKKNL